MRSRGTYRINISNSFGGSADWWRYDQANAGTKCGAFNLPMSGGQWIQIKGRAVSTPKLTGLTGTCCCGVPYLVYTGLISSSISLIQFILPTFFGLAQSLTLPTHGADTRADKGPNHSTWLSFIIGSLRLQWQDGHHRLRRRDLRKQLCLHPTMDCKPSYKSTSPTGFAPQDSQVALEKWLKHGLW